MKTFLLLLSLIFTGSALVSAQELLPAEQARELAGKANEALPRDAVLPHRVRANNSQPQGVLENRLLVLVVPDTGLAPAALRKLSAKPVVLGQLWLSEVAVARGGTPITRGEVNNVYINALAGEEPLYTQLYVLAAALSEQEKPELQIYGKGTAPLIRVPLTPLDGARQALPIELGGQRETAGSGILTVNLVGQYTANFRLRPAAD